MIKKLIVLFKTHLDIGYTDYSKNVMDIYMNSFIPNSVRVARALREENQGARLVWTTGSWLIHEYLRTHQGKLGEEVRCGIENGDICWHGLPFTTHTELMSAELFQYGLSLSQDLDREFNKKTIAAKMTDVPGHTKAMIPYLRQAGIEFLHIGVNPASAVPAVPPLFRWRADNGDMINVMYHLDYGEFSEIGDTGVAVYFAHTGDNMGVQSPDVIINIFRQLKEKMPGAEIVAGDLNDVALVVREIEETLPVFDCEIGDSWIHGVGTDPKKVSQFRALERLYKHLPEGKDKERLAQGLIMIPEHTWGMNVYRYLSDHEHYEKEIFNEMRKHGQNFRNIEASWEEQRAYLTDAVEALGEENRKEALKCLKEAERPVAHTGCFDKEYNIGETFAYEGYHLKCNRQGEIDYLEKDGVLLADAKHRLLSLVYEQFCEDDYRRFYSQYNRLDVNWAREDFTKPGMHTGSKCYQRYMPESVKIYLNEGKLFVRYSFPKEAHTKCGCPLLFDLIFTATKNELYMDLGWFGKPANRVAEAIWMGMRPIASHKKISKMGQLIDPKHVISKGQCRLHATDYGVVYDELSIETLDTALVAPQEPSLLNFCDIKPDDEDGVYFNLYNNIWGTNFPMWYEEDARFRFVLTINKRG